MKRNKIGFVTGLAAEARLLKGTEFLVGAGGGLPEGAARAAEALVARGASALVSFGLAGGLAPELPPGSVLVPSSVIDGRRTFPCDYELMEFLGGSTGRAMAASRSIIASVADKTALYKRSKQAVAVDMESGAVARVAAAHGLPFAVLRAVADAAQRDLPPAASVPLTPGGGIDLPAVIRSVAARPGQVGALLGLARDAGRARAALAARVKKLG
jgi:adenosylhomocysteine nucleosidase